LDLPILLALFAFFVSSLWGADKFVSFFGNLNNTNLPFFALLFFVLFYFLVFNLVNTRAKIISIFQIYLFCFLFLMPIMTIMVFSYSTYDILTYAHLLAGSFEDLSIYLVYFIIFSLSLLSSEYLRSRIFLNKKIRFIYNFIIFVAVVLVLRIDFLYAWYLLLLGAVLLIAIRLIFFVEQGKQKRKLLVPVLLVFVSINFLLNFYLVLDKDSLDSRLMQYRQLDNTSSLILAKDIALKNLFGLGLDNFDYAYSKYRPVEMNNDLYWDIRYNKAGSFLANLLISGGLVAILIISFISFVIVYYCFKLVVLTKIEIKQEKSLLGTYKELSLVLVPVILVMLFSLLFYSSTASSLFLLVLLVAIFVKTIAHSLNGLNKKSKLFIFKTYILDLNNDTKNRKLIVYLTLAFFLVFSISFLTVSAKFLLADKRVIDKNIEESQLLRSSILSPLRYQYNLDLAKILADKAKNSMKKGELEASLGYQRQAMEYLRLARETGASSVVAQETAGVIYRDFSSGNDGNNQLAIKAFLVALSLEPSNPVIAAELGQALLKAEDSEQASVYFKKALDLKFDYRPAELGLAKSYIASGEVEEALDILKRLAKDTMDPSVYYEMGLLYFNSGQNENAKTAFSSAVTLSPLYANAIFGLALTFDELGETEKALYHLKKLQGLNPADKQVRDKIEALQK